jgi:deoxynucleoside triphosphate triphosphohydrolase SAMHD1
VRNPTPLPLKQGLPVSLGSVSTAIQRAVSEPLLSYLESRQVGGPSWSPRIINDPVWRTVRLEPWETFVLDSPVVQRLRRIRQLGLAGYVFPGANYSRFEHSIGALHQTQRLIDAINRNARAQALRKRLPAIDPVSRADEVMLRLTALVHDCGHCFLSHVSERALRRLDPLTQDASIKDVIRDTQKYFGCQSKAPAIAEIISALIVLLPEFTQLLTAAMVPEWDDIELLCYRIGRGIVAGADPRSPYLTEVISGALDADKLDYMPRDCYMAGLPMPVDVDRLLEKVEVVRVPVAQLPEPEAYAERARLQQTDVVSVLAIQPGGARAFEELVVSRFLLYSKLYYHQKIRCLEGMVVNALELLIESDESYRDLETYLTLTDEAFLFERPVSQQQSSEVAAARALIDSVGHRRSFVRCFAFGPSLVSPYDEAAFRRGWLKLEPLVAAERTPEYRTFREEVAKRAAEYLKAAGQAGLSQALKPHDVLIDLPDVQDIAEKTEFFVGDDKIGVTLYRDQYQVGSWSEAYEDEKTIGYVYT